MSKENVQVVNQKVAEENKDKQELVLINEETIRNKIYVIRGQKVMLDFELAEIYGYTTKRFNEQVKNNIERFDEDFRFQLTKDELDNLRSKKSTSSWGGSRYLPYAFTEQGIYMLMTVLKGDLAVNQSKALIRTFKVMKDYIVENQGLINQRDYLQLSLVVAKHSMDINAIKTSLRTVDNEVAEVVDRLGNVVTKSELSGFMNIFGEPELRSEYVLWDGEPFESDIAYSAIYSKAKKSLYVIDNYIGLKTLALLKNSKEGVKNDRYIVIDYGTEQEKIFHCGPSSKDGGLRIGSIVEIREREAYHTLVDELCEMPLLELA